MPVTTARDLVPCRIRSSWSSVISPLPTEHPVECRRGRPACPRLWPGVRRASAVTGFFDSAMTSCVWRTAWTRYRPRCTKRPMSDQMSTASQQQCTGHVTRFCRCDRLPNPTFCWRRALILVPMSTEAAIAVSASAPGRDRPGVACDRARRRGAQRRRRRPAASHRQADPRPAGAAAAVEHRSTRPRSSTPTSPRRCTT